MSYMKDLATDTRTPDLGEGNVKRSLIADSILFIIPSAVITAVSIVLFNLLTDLTPAQFNVFSVTIMTAIILSLVGAASIQFFSIKKIEKNSSNAGIFVSVLDNMFYAFIYAVIVSFAFYPYLRDVANFSNTDFIYFFILTSVFILTWTINTAYWISSNYLYPAVIFSFSYVAILFLTWGFYKENPDYAITGFTIGNTVLMLALLFGVFLLRYSKQNVSDESTSQMSQTVIAALFNVLYIMALFLDKIIVWVSNGLTNNQGPQISGPYTTGAFLGLIPTFSIAVLVYFSGRAQPLVDNLYKGSLSSIQGRTELYKRFYWANFTKLFILSVLIAALVALVSSIYIDSESLKITVTVAVGSIFFVTIIYNSSVLALLGKMNISLISIFLVCALEAATIPFVSSDMWYAAWGFTIGSFLGFVVSQTVIIRSLKQFDYEIFRFVLKNNWR